MMPISMQAPQDFNTRENNEPSLFIELLILAIETIGSAFKAIADLTYAIAH